jgi:hypothetical protein
MKILLALWALLFALDAASQDCVTDIIPSSVYPVRRAQMAAFIDTTSVLVMKAGEEDDMEVLKFRQDRDFCTSRVSGLRVRA